DATRGPCFLAQTDRAYPRTSHQEPKPLGRVSLDLHGDDQESVHSFLNSRVAADHEQTETLKEPLETAVGWPYLILWRCDCPKSSAGCLVAKPRLIRRALVTPPRTSWSGRLSRTTARLQVSIPKDAQPRRIGTTRQDPTEVRSGGRS